MNNNFNMMPNQFINMNNCFNPANQLLMNPNMNQMNQNMNLMNPNMNRMNQNMHIMNQNMNLINLNPNMNLNLGQNYQNMIIPSVNQINQNMEQLNINYNKEKNNNQMPFDINNSNEKIEDVLSYINEPKMVIRFSNIDSIKKGTFIKVKLPKSLTKKELYSIAKKYQVDYYSNIILSCNNYFLKMDDTLIDGIEEGSIINIIENADFPDSSYYKALMKNNENYQRISFYFKFDGIIKKIEFPKNITFSELKKAALSKLLLNSKKYKFNNVHFDGNYKIKQFPENKTFEINSSDPLEHHWKFGKLLFVDVYNEKKNIHFNIDIGNLNSIKILISRIEMTCEKLRKIIINGNEFLKNEINDFSLKSIGINDNFKCIVEFENE